MTGGYKLYAREGWGSVLVETQLAFYGLPYVIETVDDLFQSAEAREHLARLNPLAQLPTLILPDGSVMSESAAISLHLADAAASDALVPHAGDPARPQFLRWLVFLVTNIYPTFTYADEPARFVPATAASQFREAVDRYALRMWGIVETAAGAPWFLDERFSTIDIYIAAMTRWRPKRPWFAEHAPRLHAIAARADAVPALGDVWRRNFPSSYAQTN